MARIAPMRPVTAGRFELEGSAGTEAELPARRDLVPVQPAGPQAARHFAQPRPQAAFLAHLLAVAQHAPQTQEKRRAEPQEAVNRYTAAGKAAPVRPGLSLKRAV